MITLNRSKFLFFIDKIDKAENTQKIQRQSLLKRSLQELDLWCHRGPLATYVSAETHACLNLLALCVPTYVRYSYDIMLLFVLLAYVSYLVECRMTTAMTCPPNFGVDSRITEVHAITRVFNRDVAVPTVQLSCTITPTAPPR